MYKTIIFVFLLVAYSATFAQGSGKEGKGNSVTNSGNNNENFTISQNANYECKISEVNASVWVDTNKWIVSNPYSSTYSFRHKDPYFLEVNLYISSGQKTDEEHLNSNIEIWKGLFDNFIVNQSETRDVNGTKVSFYEVEGDFGATPEISYGYLKALQTKTITFRVVVATSKHEYFQADVMELLNGLVFNM
ncbi:MAG: hypothetical protein JXL97_17055 [Bacteroidales bacterium]|nr:hypothetical protein [Bacteroidales bacterium]